MNWPLPAPDDATSPGDPSLWMADLAPARLGGMARPARGFAFASLADVGFTDIVCLRHEVDYDATPLVVHHAPLADLVGGRTPEDPFAERQAVVRAADVVDELLANGRRVVVHCGLGVGRTGTVIGVVLVRRGHPPEEVRGWLDAVQKRRGLPGWPESAWQGRQLVSKRSGL